MHCMSHVIHMSVVTFFFFFGKVLDLVLRGFVMNWGLPV